MIILSMRSHKLSKVRESLLCVSYSLHVCFFLCESSCAFEMNIEKWMWLFFNVGSYKSLKIEEQLKVFPHSRYSKEFSPVFILAYTLRYAKVLSNIPYIQWVYMPNSLPTFLTFSGGFLSVYVLMWIQRLKNNKKMPKYLPVIGFPPLLELILLLFFLLLFFSLVCLL